MSKALTVFVIILAEVEPDIVGIGKNRIIVFWGCSDKLSRTEFIQYFSALFVLIHLQQDISQLYLERVAQASPHSQGVGWNLP